MHSIGVFLGKKLEVDLDLKITKKLDLKSGITAILEWEDGHNIKNGKTVAYVRTDYFGGCGDQSATVTENGKEICHGNTELGHASPINEALRLLGVKKTPGKDEFDTVGLGNYRTNQDFEEELCLFSEGISEESSLKLYTEGYVLKENEYLLKIRKSNLSSVVDTGFLSKLTQKGQLPKSFDDWGKTYHDRTPLPTYIFEETYRSGWKLLSWRFGQSQNWARVVS